MKPWIRNSSAVCILSALVVAQEPRTGALELVDGQRIGGQLEADGSTYVLRRGKSVRRFEAERVRAFVPVGELDAELDALAQRIQAENPFQRAQLGLRAFEIGHPDRGFAILTALIAEKQTPPSRARLEARAAHERVERLDRTRSLAAVGRKYLHSLAARGGSPEKRTESVIAWRVLAELLDQERRTTRAANASTDSSSRRAKRKESLADVCRKFAANALHASRRRVARRALLAHDEAGQRFVYRQAIAWPKGPTRTAVVDDLRETGHSDPAARYLASWLGKPHRTLELRAVEALGSLGSPAAIAPLRALSKSIPARARAAGTPAGATRANVQFTTEQAYVADYQVEVATAASIAKPVVQTIRSGVVLDATVGGIWADRYYYVLKDAVRSSLRKLDRPAKKRVDAKAKTEGTR